MQERDACTSMPWYSIACSEDEIKFVTLSSKSFFSGRRRAAAMSARFAIALPCFGERF